MAPATRPRHGPLPLVLAVLLLSGGFVLAAAAELRKLADGQAVDVVVYPGVSRWKLVPHLWTHKTVNVTCPGTSEFSVYVARGPQELERAVAAKQTAWCGLAGWLSWDANSCITRISPFQETTVAALKPNFRGGGRACEFSVSERLWVLWLVQGASGVLLFWYADLLVDSQAFRLSSGTAGFVLLSTLIIAFVIYRSVPNKRRMAAATALFGSSFLALLKYFFGTWIPSFDQLVTNKWALLYMLASGLLGLAVTYYYDDPANEKLNTILARGLQLLGLAMVAASTAAPEVSAAAALALLASRAMRLPQARKLYQRLGRKGSAVLSARRSAVVAAYGAQAEPRGGNHKLPAAVAGPQESAPQSPQVPSEVEEALTLTGAGSASASGTHRGLSSPLQRRLTEQPAAVSPLVERGYVVNEASGRMIQIGKGTYNKLLKEGYHVDTKQGVMTPPGARTSGRMATSPRHATSAAGRAKGGASASSPAALAFGLSAASGLPLPD